MADIRSSTDLHRALASPVRARLLLLLRQAPTAQDVEALAEQLDLHVNTVRSHLTVLEGAGLVVSEPQVRQTPGRPRLGYQAAPDAPGPEDADGYRLLSEILASHLAASSDDPAAAAARAGSAWGRSLVDRPTPTTDLTPSMAIGRVVEVLADRGFAPDVDDADTSAPRVVLRDCPFLDVARSHQAVVCAVHLGLIRGALAQLHPDVEVVELQPLVEPVRCVAQLQVQT